MPGGSGDGVLDRAQASDIQYGSRKSVYLREVADKDAREGILISQDSKGRWADNIVMERFRRTYKHEFFLLEDIPSLQIAKERTARWLDYYNGQRAHSTLGNQSPQMYAEAAGMTLEPHF